MSNEINSIHDFEFELIAGYYSLVERQGPGSPEITQKALSFIEGLDENSKIADIGCGTGGQTRELAKRTKGQIVGIDLFEKFITLFNQKAKAKNLTHRLTGRVESMDKLSFEDEELDLIWSEGAIYNIGFENGLRYWSQFLKKGAYIAISEATWFTNERPQEIEDFWMDAYPGIDTFPNKLKQLADCGYAPVAAFIIPEECWTEQFYAPQVAAQESFLADNKGNQFAEDFIANQRHEEKLYNKYKEFYGYAFYISKKL